MFVCLLDFPLIFVCIYSNDAIFSDLRLVYNVYLSARRRVNSMYSQAHTYNHILYEYFNETISFRSSYNVTIYRSLYPLTFKSFSRFRHHFFLRNERFLRVCFFHFKRRKSVYTSKYIHIASHRIISFHISCIDALVC